MWGTKFLWSVLDTKKECTNIRVNLSNQVLKRWFIFQKWNISCHINKQGCHSHQQLQPSYVCVCHTHTHTHTHTHIYMFFLVAQTTWNWSLVQEDPWRREWLPTPIFLPGEFHWQRSLVDYSPWGYKESDTTEWLTLSFIYVCVCVCARVYTCSHQTTTTSYDGPWGKEAQDVKTQDTGPR